MTLTTKTTRTALFGSVLMVAIASVGIAPVFAASVTASPPYSTNQAVPNGWGCGNKCYAEVHSDGANVVYAKAISSGGADGPHDGIARNNHSGSQTSSPTLTTSATTIQYQADLTYDGDITYGWGSLADYRAGAELYRKQGNDWWKVGSCLELVVEGGDNYSDSVTKSCNYSSSGTQEFRIGATHKAGAYTVWFGADTIVDFWLAQTDNLRICESSC